SYRWTACRSPLCQAALSGNQGAAFAMPVSAASGPTTSAAALASPAQGPSGGGPLSAYGGRDPIRRAPLHPDPKDERYQEQRRHVAKQMTPFCRIAEGLQCHDYSVHHARPHGEPDDALMRVRIARRHQKEHAERRIDTDDHHQIVGVPLTPCPAGGPDDTQQIDAEY